MSSIDSIDHTIEDLIENLVDEHNRDGFLSAATSERKAEIIDQIAKLRASMTPKCTCQK